jgi:hypothetical protein
MKVLPFLITLCMSIFAYGENDVLRLSAVSAGVNALLKENQSGGDYRLDDLKELHRALAGNRPNIWAMPPWMLSGIRNAVEPVRPVASQLALSENKHERFYGAVLNSYLAPTPESKNLLLKLANDSEAPIAGAALDTLFGMKWESHELREEVIASLEDTGSGKKSTLAGLAKNNAGDWGLVDAMPGLVRILEKDYYERGRLNSAVGQLKQLGTNAEAALPTLRKILESERLKKSPDFQNVEALENAVLVISGSYKMPEPREDAFPFSSEKASQDTERSEKRQPVIDSKLSDTTTEKPAPFPWWLIVSSVVILALSLAAWLNARKAKPTS